MVRGVLALLAAAAFTVAAAPQSRAQVDTCAALVAAPPAGARITAATLITPAPTWAPPGAGGETTSKRLCRVEGVIERKIGFEVWLPEKSEWSGRLLGAGVGGSGGTFNYSELARAVDRGFAGVTTDTGHKASEAGWIADPETAENFTHRSVHLSTVAAKAIVERYYGAAARHSYFVGCSGGGRQALKEAQRYPQDYDGIIAGAAGPNNPQLSARHLATALRQQANPAAALTAAEWGLMEVGATRTCDGLDGAVDGLVADPRTCPFKPRDLLCRPGGPAQCLSPEKVAMAEAIYAPLKDETGKQLDVGLWPGQQARPGPAPTLILEMFGQVVHGDPNWDPRGFVISRDVAAAHAKLPDMRANSVALEPFKRRGGKLILYHTWWDNSVIPQTTFEYYDALKAKNRDHERFTALYMAPGVYHCRGGPGPDTIGGYMARPVAPGRQYDLLAQLVDWVEKGERPGPVVAAKVAQGAVTAEHLLCPYPARARFDGKGDVKKASSFTCRR